MSEPEDDYLKRSTVVFSPHPDDETLGFGGTIVKKKKLDSDITVVFTTDGRASYRHLLPEDKMKSIREKEALAAGRVLSFEEKDPIFLEYKNGELFENRKSFTSKVVNFLTEKNPMKSSFLIKDNP